MPWQFNKKLNRYQSTGGRIISFAEATEKVDEWIDDTSSIVEQLSQLLAEKRLSIQDWRSRMIDAIKGSYIEQAILAGGGREQMTSADWGVVGNALRRQYEFLEGFANEIAAGHLTQGQIAMRSKMYINSSRQVYWRIRDRREKADEELWITEGDDRVCSPCTRAGAMGWQPTGIFGWPGSGVVFRDTGEMCEGLTSCRCRKEYR